MYRFGYKDKIAVFICAAVFKRRFMVTAYVIGHKVNSSDGAPAILSSKQGNTVVRRLNRLIQITDGVVGQTFGLEHLSENRKIVHNRKIEMIC